MNVPEPRRNVQRFPVGLVFKAHRLCVSLNSRLESNKEEEEGRRLIAVLLPSKKPGFFKKPEKFGQGFEPLPGKSGKTLSPDFSGAKVFPRFGRVVKHWSHFQGKQVEAHQMVVP